MNIEGDLKMYPMQMTEQQIAEAIEEFKRSLTRVKTTSGIIEMKYKLGNTAAAKATLVIKQKAWNKIMALVDECSKEIAWHGVVDKEGTTYTISDILVFPQTVTGATVTSDETEYSLWLANQPDEVFNKLRFHGHSHVNMNVSPSGVDTKYQNDIMNNLNDFYIFGIFNKKTDCWLMICDVEDNIVYECKDIDLIAPSQTEWAKKEIKELVKIKQPTTYKKNENTGTQKKQYGRQLDLDDYGYGYYGGYYG